MFFDEGEERVKTIKTHKVIPFDVDDTLILWRPDDKTNLIKIKHPMYTNAHFHVKPNKKAIDLLNKHKAAGDFIIVWSAGGYDWALNIVKALKLKDKVDLIMTKPDLYYDDLPVQEWMTNRVDLSGFDIHRGKSND